MHPQRVVPPAVHRAEIAFMWRVTATTFELDSIIEELDSAFSNDILAGQGNALSIAAFLRIGADSLIENRALAA